MESSTYVEELMRHETWARRLAFRLVRDAAAADDLVQEAWVVALRKRPDAERSLRPWLGRVLRNMVLLRSRTSRNRARRESAARSPGASPDPAALAERLETHRRLAEVVGRLPEHLRSVVLLRYYEDLDSTEIGRRLGIAPGTVRWRLSRALSRVREELESASGAGRAWVLPLLPLAAASPAAAKLLRETRRPVAAGPTAASGGVGATAARSWIAWSVAAVALTACIWLGVELRGLARRVDQRAPSTPTDTEVVRLRRELARSRERAAGLQAEVERLKEERVAREKAAGAGRRTPGEAAAEGLSAETLARLRELAELLDQAGRLTARLKEEGVEEQAYALDENASPVVRELIEKRNGLIVKISGIVLPLASAPEPTEAFVSALEQENDPSLQYALASAIVSRLVIADPSAAGAESDVSRRLRKLFLHGDLGAGARGAILSSLDLGTEAAREARDEVVRLAEQGESEELRIQAITKLAELGDASSVTLLRRVARDDPDPGCRQAAIIAFASRHAGTKDPEAIQFLDDLGRETESKRMLETIRSSRELIRQDLASVPGGVPIYPGRGGR